MRSHLERELALARKRLAQQEKDSPQDLLACYRKFVKGAEARVQTEHRCGGGGRLVARQRSAIIDVLLEHLWDSALRECKETYKEEAPPMTLMALGGYGRSELNPFSDVDIMFLHAPANAQGQERVNAVVQKVLYTLWDIGFKVGHSTRTIRQVLDRANADLQVKTAMIDARFLDGDEELFNDLQKRFITECVVGHEAEYIQWRLNDQKERHAKQGGSVFMQEPNLKEGCGGLRDYHNLHWIAFFWKRIRTTAELADHELISRNEVKQIERAFDTLMRARTELHFISARENDTMALSMQGKIATGLGYKELPQLKRVENFMRDYYTAAHDIFFLTNAAARRMGQNTGAPRKGWFWITPPKPSRPEYVDGFVIRDHEINFESKNVFSEDPFRMVRVFQLAQQRNLEMSHDLLRLIRRRLLLITRTFIYNKATREMFMSILERKGQVARILRMMHQTGVLGKVIPEFAPLTCLVQHEFFHRYTADEHTLVCIEQLDALVNVDSVQGASRYQELMKSIEKPQILYMAMLLHDVGKSENVKLHAEASALLAMRLCRRWRLPTEELRVLTFLADHHLTLSQFAQRRNVDDVETIYEFARIVESEVRLDYLMLLTYADGRGTTGGEGWSDWKETLVWHLYNQTKLLLQYGPEFEKKAEAQFHQLLDDVSEKAARHASREEVMVHFACLPRRYVRVSAEADIVQHVISVHDFLKEQQNVDGNPLSPVLNWIHHHDRGHSELIVVTWDRDHLFLRITGALSMAGLNILSADIFTRQDDIVLDSFRVCTDRNEAVTDSRDQRIVEEMLGEALQKESFDFEPLLKKMRTKRRPKHWVGDGFPTRLIIENSSSDYTRIEVQTPDRPALLHDLVKAITQEGIQISFARIETEKGAAIDNFYLSQTGGGKLIDTDVIQRLKMRVLDCTDGFNASTAETEKK